jgi:predicted regulator of Ras-like GTPase activity (Roadblock/LC7/MglB family)
MVKKKNIQGTAIIRDLVTIEETAPAEDDIRRKLEEIKTENGVIGYIMRNSVSAAIDLKDPAKIIDYALLSSSAFDASEELTSFLDLGDIKNIMVETKNVKVLSLCINETRISLFIEKDADLNRFLRKLQMI